MEIFLSQFKGVSLSIMSDESVCRCQTMMRMKDQSVQLDVGRLVVEEQLKTIYIGCEK